MIKYVQQSEEEPMSSADTEQSTRVVEEMGYDAPFVSYTWERWQEMQVRTLLCFTRFQRAIEQRQAQLALSIAIEIQEIGIAMQREAGQWIGVPEQ
jgi:hypothetical protein